MKNIWWSILLGVQMYFVSKTLAEQAAWKFAKENGLDFITIIPPLVVGPFLMPSMPPSLITALSLINGTCCHSPCYPCINHQISVQKNAYHCPMALLRQSNKISPKSSVFDLMVAISRSCSQSRVMVGG